MHAVHAVGTFAWEPRPACGELDRRRCGSAKLARLPPAPLCLQVLVGNSRAEKYWIGKLAAGMGLGPACRCRVCGVPPGMLLTDTAPFCRPVSHPCSPQFMGCNLGYGRLRPAGDDRRRQWRLRYVQVCGDCVSMPACLPGTCPEPAFVCKEPRLWAGRLSCAPVAVRRQCDQPSAGHFLYYARAPTGPVTPTLPSATAGIPYLQFHVARLPNTSGLSRHQPYHPPAVRPRRHRPRQPPAWPACPLLPGGLWPPTAAARCWQPLTRGTTRCSPTRGTSSSAVTRRAVGPTAAAPAGGPGTRSPLRPTEGCCWPATTARAACIPAATGPLGQQWPPSTEPLPGWQPPRPATASGWLQRWTLVRCIPAQTG